MTGLVTKTIMMSPADVETFVKAASKCDFDIDISNHSYVVDAKSIVGVFGLDFAKPLYVKYDGYNSEFEALIRSLACAC